ncbi:MAG: hypothetical protein AMS25_09855 [Gemmatimonas sp. SM23_52]|nr:MAG: hypothetical protein AMS25_09855 [Gemmatimonas sp. SM23_52]
MPKLDRCSRLALALLVALVAQVSVATQSGVAQEKGAKEGNAATEPTETTPEVLAVQDVALARQLAVYGHRTQTAEPFLAAARILVQTPYREPALERQQKADEGAEAGDPSLEKSTPPSLTVAGLLSAARQLAGDDENVLAMIAELEGSMEKGRAGGPAVHPDRVLAHTTDIYEITFSGGESAIIEVVGDGDTDLDCFVYDENSNLIDSDTDYTDHCILIWTPRWTGPFQLQIKNLGSVWNAYVLTTN